MTNWRRVSLEEITESVDYGVTASACNIPSGPKFLRITDIQNGTVNWETVPWCECDARTAAGSKLETGDIVFARTGATTGKSFLINTCPENAVFASYLIRVRVQKNIEPRYVSNFFQTADYWAQITRGSRGAAQPGVNATTLKALEIPVPLLPEQRRIAAILDQANALRAKRREALAQLDSLAQSSFIAMFGDPVANPQRWPVSSLKNLGKVSTGRTPPSAMNGMFGGAIPFVTPGDLGSNSPVNRTLTAEGVEEVTTVRAGATLVCCIGTVGKIDKVTTRSAFNQQINAVEWSDEIDDDYGFFALSFYKALMASRAASTTVPILNKSAFEKIAIPVPPIEFQKAFSKRIEVVKSLRKTYRSALSESDRLFASLQHLAFRGEL